MKRFQVSVIITVISILCCVASLIYINERKNYYCDLLESTYESSVSDDIEGAISDIDKFTKNWKKDESFLMLILPHNDVEEITFSVKMLKEYLKSEEMPEFRAELKRVTALVDHLWAKEVPSLVNVL